MLPEFPDTRPPFLPIAPSISAPTVALMFLNSGMLKFVLTRTPSNVLTSVVLLRLYLRRAAPSRGVKSAVVTPLDATLTQPPVSVNYKLLTEGGLPPSHSPLLARPWRPRPL